MSWISFWSSLPAGPTAIRSDAERQHAGGKDQERIAPPLSPPSGSRIIVVRV
jgi:hypothetical protein